MMSHAEHASFVIQGLTNQGRPFRPSNWAERLQSCLVTVGPQRKQSYCPHVHVSFISGVRSLAVDHELWETNPDGYEFLMHFAEDNNLKILEGEDESSRSH